MISNILLWSSVTETNWGGSRSGGKNKKAESKLIYSLSQTLIFQSKLPERQTDTAFTPFSIMDKTIFFIPSDIVVVAAKN